MELLKPNQIFAGRYRIERFLAQGGMGAIFVAEQTATELVVAIKVLFPHILASTDAVEKFELEARVAARVMSEHIVKVLDAGFDEETRLPFLVMELLEGRSLEKVVLDGGPLRPERVVHYLAQCAAGLDRAHGYVDRQGIARAIVHRDLKPDNLFLARQGSGEIIKILDFGVAKVVSDTAHLSQELKGTPLYMAYEQATGSKITPQTDVWALGLIAFFLLTGRSYWLTPSREDCSLSALFGEVLTQPIVAPSERARQLGVTPTWPATFDDWFLHCVDREPTRRFSSAGEAGMALAFALGVPAPANLLPGINPDATFGSSDATSPTATSHHAAAETEVPTSASVSRRPTRGIPALGVGVGVTAIGAVMVGAYLLSPTGISPAGPAASELASSSPSALPQSAEPPHSSHPAESAVASAAIAGSARPAESAGSPAPPGGTAAGPTTRPTSPPAPATPAPVARPAQPSQPSPAAPKPPTDDIWNER